MRAFEWDPAKDAANRRKHGIGFLFARRAFADPFAVDEQDRLEGGEVRWRMIAEVGGDLLFLAYAWSIQHDGTETIRIISARLAEPHERRRYWRDRLGEE